MGVSKDGERGDETEVEAAFKDSLLFFASETGVLEIFNCSAAAEEEDADVADTDGESEEGVNPVVDVTLRAAPRRLPPPLPLLVPVPLFTCVGFSPLVPELIEQQLKNEAKKFPPPPPPRVDEDDDDVEADLLMLEVCRCC